MRRDATGRLLFRTSVAPVASTSPPGLEPASMPPLHNPPEPQTGLETGQMLRLGNSYLSQVDVLDPLRSTCAHLADVFSLMFHGLLRYQPSGGVELDLGSHWYFDTKRPDGHLGVIFELDRPHLTFHNGQPLTVDDVVFTHSQLRFSPVLGERWRESIREVTTDGNRVIFVLQARGFSPKVLPLLTLGIVSRHAYRASAAQPNLAPPAGCGPFKFNRFDGRKLVLDAFPDYYAGRPRLRQIQLEAHAPARLIQLLATGRILAATLPYSARRAAALGKLPHIKVIAVPAAQPALLYAQASRLRERVLNLFDPGAQAHLWHVDEAASEPIPNQASPGARKPNHTRPR